MALVSEVMSLPLLTAPVGITLAAAVEHMVAAGVSSLALRGRGGQPQAIMNEHDVVMHPLPTWSPTRPIGSCTSRGPGTPAGRS